MVGYLTFNVVFVLQDQDEYDVIATAVGFYLSLASHLPVTHQISLLLYFAAHFVPVTIQLRSTYKDLVERVS